MKELSTEEKAKAYNNLIERLKDFQFEYRFSAFSDTIERYFPEIKEPEDEKIRKDLISFLDDIWHLGKNANFDKWDKSDCSNWIAWLEKQGETVEINPTEFDTRLQGTCQPPDKIIEESHQDNADHIIDIVTEQEKPSEWSEEDERIRRVIRGWIYTRPASFFDGISKEKMLAWIEKQGEKKSTDKIQIGKEYKCIASPRYSTFMRGKIYKPKDKFLCSFMNFCSDCFEPIEDSEPKFKVGDWVVTTYGEVSQVISVDKVCDGYTLDNNNYFSGTWCDMYHLWTIDDAKDGDVLVDCNKDEAILMFRGIGNTEWDDVIDYHCYYSCFRKAFCVQKGVEYWGNTNDHNLKPATKEQRDLFFQKMKKAGYEWDSENKEVKKISK